MSSQAQIETRLKGQIDQRFRCPDGQVRKLMAFECEEGGLFTIQFSGGHFVEIELAQFDEKWAPYSHAGEGDVTGAKTTELMPTTSMEVAQQTADNQAEKAEKLANQVMDTSDMVKLMHDQMKKVASGNPAAIPQANAMSGLAKQIIEAGKLKMNIMRTVHQINQPTKP